MKAIILVVMAILILAGCRNPSAPDNLQTETEKEIDTMEWQTPKKDWKLGDVPLPPDLNRWEGNAEEAYNLAVAAQVMAGRFHVSGNVSSAIGVSAGAEGLVQKFSFTVPARSILTVVYTGMDLGESSLRLRISVEGETNYYTSSSADEAGWIAIGGVLYTNNTDVAVDKKIRVHLQNPSGYNAVAEIGTSWMFILQNTAL